MELWNFRGKQDSIAEALHVSIPDHAVICLTGAGGKTSLLLAWAKELTSAGKRTVITTTTHMFNPACKDRPDSHIYKGIPVVFVDTDYDSNHEDNASNTEQDKYKQRIIADMDALLDEHGLAMIATPDPSNPNKVMSPPEWVLDYFSKSADVLIIEADGSRRMPIKWPAPWEPVVPENTDITVCVAGLSSLGKPLPDVMYRAGHLPANLDREAVDEVLLSAIMSSPDGGQKGARGEFRIYMNQADNDSLRESASQIQKMLAVRGLQSAWGSLKVACAR